MKGKTIIELKDVKSGKVQRVEHHNTFQSSVLEKLFKPKGSLGASLISSGVDQWKWLVGGLLVFDKTIEVGTQYPPQDVNMTANGVYNVTNNTDPVELGTWNESESYVTKDEIVMTYDFSTSQGNGKINSVCLTSATAGKAGVGNVSQTRLPQGSRVQPFVKEIQLPRLQNEQCIVTDGIYFYIISKDGATISVKKRWANIVGIDLIKGSNANTYDDTYTITVPSDYANVDIRYVKQIVEGKLAFIIDRSSNYTAIVVDIPNRNVSSEITIPKLGSIIAVGGVYPLQVAQIHTDSDVQYISIYDTDSAQWILDAETNGWSINEVDLIGERYYFKEYNEGDFCCVNNGVLVPSNIRWLRGNYYATGTYLPTLEMMQYGDDYQSLDGWLCIPSMYLATINNLEEEIEKDNTKTMKIIYVLSRR